MVKAIIFDMDGVLIEAKDWHYEALNKALYLFGFEISRYEHLKFYDGLPTRKKLEILTAEHDLPIALHDFINEMKQIYTMDIVNIHCKPRFNHEYALAKLYDDGYKLAVASNSIRTTIDIMMQRARLDQYLEFKMSNEDVTHAKPNSEIYVKAISKLGLKPEECLIIEDNENGIRAAQNSGAHVMIVKEVSDVNYDNIIQKIGSLKE